MKAVSVKRKCSIPKLRVSRVIWLTTNISDLYPRLRITAN